MKNSTWKYIIAIALSLGIIAGVASVMANNIADVAQRDKKAAMREYQVEFNKDSIHFFDGDREVGSASIKTCPLIDSIFVNDNFNNQ